MCGKWAAHFYVFTVWLGWSIPISFSTDLHPNPKMRKVGGPKKHVSENVLPDHFLHPRDPGENLVKTLVNTRVPTVMHLASSFMQ